jgi:hypothetical protein
VEHENVIPQPRTFQQVTPSVNNNTLFDMDQLMKLVSTEWESEKKTKKWLGVNDTLWMTMY